MRHRLVRHIKIQDNTAITHSINREDKFQYLHNQYLHSLDRMYNRKTLLMTNGASHDLSSTIEGSLFEDIIVNHCFMHEIENDFVYTPQCYRENVKSTNILHLENDEYYEHDCISSMENASQRSMVDENEAYWATENMEQEVNENGVQEVSRKMKKMFQIYI